MRFTSTFVLQAPRAEGTCLARGRSMGRGVALPLGVVVSLAVVCEYLGCSTDPSGPSPDTDGDGLTDAEELSVYGTSPLLADTDGDGLSDFQEVVTLGFDPDSDPYRFNPRIADVAQMAVAIVGPPIVTIQETDDRGATHTIDNSRSQTVTVGVTNSTTTTNRRIDSLSTSRTDENAVSLQLPLPRPTPPTDAGEEEAAEEAAEAPPSSSGDDQGSGATITLSNSVATTVNPSTTFDTSIDFTNEQMQQNAETVALDEAYAQSHNITASAGFLKLATVIQNRSHVAFRVTNIILAAAFVDDSGVVLPVQNLIIDQGIITGFVPFALGPGEATGITNFISPALTLETTQALLTNAHALQIRLATYELDDATTKSLAFAAAEVDAKTATVVIDSGPPHVPEVYQVATDLDPTRLGVTVAKVLGDILRIPFVADGTSGLTSVRKIAVDASGAGWRVTHLHKDGAEVAATNYGADGGAYDFGGIVLHAGDVLHLAFVDGSDTAEGSTTMGAPPLATGPATDGGLKVHPP
jgi:hypothetical protein